MNLCLFMTLTALFSSSPVFNNKIIETKGPSFSLRITNPTTNGTS